MFRRDIEIFFESMISESKVLLENICKETENRNRNLLKDREEKKTLAISQTLHNKNEVKIKEIRVRGCYGAGEGNFDDLILSDPDNSYGEEAYETQTLHANNEAKNNEIRVGGNDGARGYIF